MLININNDCNKCMECVEVCQTRVLTEDHINTISMLKCFNNHFKTYALECTYCESCEDICEQKAIRIINPELEELQ